MTNNILIFRTDRIGDLLSTCPAMLTIKKKIDNSKITLITSKKNHDYAKSFQFFDNVIMFPSKNLFEKIKFVYNLSKKKFDYILVLDGKDRSLISSIFIKSPYKVGIISEKRVSNIWKFFKIKLLNNTESKIIELLEESLKYCKISESISNYNFLNSKKDNNFSSKIKINNYLHIHLDEKWFKDLYIKRYTDINPSYNDMVNFLNLIVKKYNVLITTGLIDFKLIDNLKNNFFDKLNEKIYFKKSQNNSIYFIYKPSFEDLESLLRKSKILITCIGAITHAANSFNVEIIDIIEENCSLTYSRYTSYLSNYKTIFRNKFTLIQQKLLEHLNMKLH